MKRLQVLLWSSMAAVFVYVVLGCGGYGQLNRWPTTETEAKLEYLVNHADHYHVYYFGSNEQNASGILFDPKDDENRLIPGKMWLKVDDGKRIAHIIDGIDIQDFSNYNPRLFDIVGTDQSHYGYLFTGWRHVVLKPSAKGAIEIYGLKDSPNYQDGDPPMIRSLHRSST